MLRKFPPIWLMLFGLFALFTSPAMAFDIKTAEMTKLSCKDYELSVTGLADKGYCVNYMFTLTTGADPSTTVMGNIPVDGSFDTSVSGSFSLTTDGVFTGFGVASLKTSCLNDGTVVNTVPIDFGSFIPLNCPSTPSPEVEIKKFTNGHDGDNANGVPTSGQGDFQATGTVAQISEGNTVTWTYRVTNTGNEQLVKVHVSDNQLGDITSSCPKAIEPLDVGESVDCEVSSPATSLVLNPPFVVEGCGDKRPTYANVGTVTAEGATTFTPVEDSNPSHYCNPPPTPACDLTLNKTCEITPPTGTDFTDTCKGKIQKFTLIWPSNSAGPINISGIANDAPGGVVNPGQKVTFTGPWTTNDLYLDITGAVTGRSTIHVSCSDKDMDAITATNLEQQQVSPLGHDCGKVQGNGKAVSGTWINTWVLDGLVDAEGRTLNCTTTPPPPTSSCSFQASEPPQCGTGGTFKPSTLTFKYTGGGCSTQSNSQAAGKTSCSGQINPTLPVTVTASAGLTGSVTVQPGGTFTINRAAADTTFTLTNAGGTETDKIHTSCSQPLMVGDVYFSLTLVAEDGKGSGNEVTYRYGVTNTGSSAVTGISVTDDKLGAIGTIASLAGGATQTLTKSAFIGETTTNVATATGSSCPPSGVQATATVTVLSPPPCTVTDTFASLADDKIVYKVTNTGKKVVTLDTLTLNFPNARQQVKEVRLDGAIYKADQSTLVVTPGVTIGASNWTNPDVSKRQLNPGETRNLEIFFTKKAKASASDFSGTATFKEGCEIDFAP